MDTIELWSGTTKALISLDGAWLTNLSDENGDILYPKRLLEGADGSKKARGGCHVCLPNFGVGGETELAQHGFGRTSVWSLVNQTDASARLILRGGSDEYASLDSTLTYELNDSSITITLQLKNAGDKVLRVAPGFHPYFALSSDETAVKIDDQPYDLEDLAGTLFVEGQSKELALEKRNLHLSAENLSTWAVWTDQLANYVCVEPTFDGPTFVRNQPDENENLQPGATNTYSHTISWL